MESIPLYPQGARALVESCPPQARDPECRRCRIGSRGAPRHRCLGADGEPGGLLVVSDYPGLDEDRAGRPFVGKAGGYLREFLARHWRGPVVLTNAVLCAPGAEEVGDAEVDACRGYLAGTLAEARPSHILALGAVACHSITGRDVQPFSARGGHCWVGGVPCWLGFNPSAALRNRFVRGWWEEDVRAALTRDPPPRHSEGALVRVVISGDDAVAAEADLAGCPWFAYDTETFGSFHDPGFRVLCAALCGAGHDDAWVWGPEALRSESCLVPLRRLLASGRAVAHNAKFDGQAVAAAPIQARAPALADTLLLRRLLDSEADGSLGACGELVGMGGHKLEAQAAVAAAVEVVKRRAASHQVGQRCLSFDAAPADDEVIARVVGSGIDPLRVAYAAVPRAVLLRYCGLDAVATARLYDLLRRRLEGEPEVRRVWEQIVSGASGAFERVEAWGIAADRGGIENARRYFAAREEEVRARLAGHGDFDPGSTKDLRRFLFKELGLDSTRATRTGLESTDADALEELRGVHPVVNDLLQWREFGKMRGTYVDGLLRHLRGDGRIHPTFRIDGARSGRVSCTEPNLQNQPKRSEDAKWIRRCFVAPPGRVLLTIDFSQVELRVAAMLSGDPEMIRIYREGLDYHQRTAEMIARSAWGIEPSEVTPRHRELAKTVNFSTLYGSSAYALSKQIGIPVEEAEAIQDGIKGAFTTFARWAEGRVREARTTGLTWTYWGGQRARRRSLWRIAEPGDEVESQKVRETAERGAYNTPVQGTANDYAVASLVELVRWIEDERIERDCKVVLTVHDEIMLEVAEHMVEEAAWQGKRIMEGWPTTHGVPLRVDAKVGRNWGEMVKLNDWLAGAKGAA